MKILSQQPMTGVNRWFGDRTFAAVVTDLPEEPVPAPLLGTLGEALDRLPLPAHQAGASERLRRAVPPGTGWGRVLIELTAELQFLTSEYLGMRAVQPMRSPSTVRMALECPEFSLAEVCLDAAMRSCARLNHGQSLELAKVYDDLAAHAHEVCLGGSTGPLVAAARRRGIPAYRLDPESLVQLGEGIHQQRIYTAMTSRTSHIAVRVSTDKHLVSQQWSRVGIPIAKEQLAHDEEDALRAAVEVGWPVVVKPVDADYGRGVSLPLRTGEQVRAAYHKARSCSASGRVLVQRYLRGACHRLLVVEGRLAAAVRRDPIGVRGDGRHSVRELVEQLNRAAHESSEQRISLGDSEQALLAEAGFSPETVPEPGVKIPLSHNVLEIYSDITERVHPETRELASDAARVIGLDVAGLDVIARDISTPLAEQGGGFLEINAQPAIAIHRAPHCDHPRTVGDAIIASLFPPPASGRVPLIIVLGGQLADDVVAGTAEHFHQRGIQVAISTPSRTCWNDRPLLPDSTSLAARLCTLMLHPRTEAAVVSATPGEVMHAGLGADQCHVLVLADGPEDATGDEEWAALLRQLAAAARRCAINLDDPCWAKCAAVPLPSTVLASLDPASPLLLQHLATGRVTVSPQEEEILVRAGEVELARFRAGGSTPSLRSRTLAAAAIFALGLESETCPRPHVSSHASI